MYKVIKKYEYKTLHFELYDECNKAVHAPIIM